MTVRQPKGIYGVHRVEEDGSGGITLTEVSGNCIVKQDGGGGVRHRRVRVRVDVPSD